MRGHVYFNFPAFDKARDELYEEGWIVFSPADIDREHGLDCTKLPLTTDWNDVDALPNFSLQEAFDRDIECIKNSEAIYMLKGWQSSTGATAEHACAKWLGKDILYEEESICEEAYRIQGGDRQQDYGDPTQNFDDIASLWNAYLMTSGEAKLSYPLNARDVAHLMILMKIARNCHKPKRDNWVDIAGYAQCGGKIDKV